MNSPRLAGIAALLGSASTGLAADTTPDEQPRWKTTVGTMTVGTGGRTATFSDIRATCGMLQLTFTVTAAAADVRQCLSGGEQRRVFFEMRSGTTVA